MCLSLSYFLSNKSSGIKLKSLMSHYNVRVTRYLIVYIFDIGLYVSNIPNIRINTDISYLIYRFFFCNKSGIGNDELTHAATLLDQAEKRIAKLEHHLALKMAKTKHEDELSVTLPPLDASAMMSHPVPVPIVLPEVIPGNKVR